VPDQIIPGRLTYDAVGPIDKANIREASFPEPYKGPVRDFPVISRDYDVFGTIVRENLVPALRHVAPELFHCDNSAKNGRGGKQDILRKQMCFSDQSSPHHAAATYATLPTRIGSAARLYVMLGESGLNIHWSHST